MVEYRIVKIETFFVSGQMQEWAKEVENFAGEKELNELKELILNLQLKETSYTVEYKLEGREKRKWNEITESRIKPPRGCQKN